MAKVGRPRARQGELARGAPKRHARGVGKMCAQTHEEPKRKQPHKGALGKRASRRTDKNQFWLGGRFFYTAWPRFGDQGKGKASWQDGRPNARRARARQGELARGARKRNARPVGKMGAQTHEAL